MSNRQKVQLSQIKVPASTPIGTSPKVNAAGELELATGAGTPPVLSVPVILLEVGQTVAQYASANGGTVAVPSILARKG